MLVQRVDLLRWRGRGEVDDHVDVGDESVDAELKRLKPTKIVIVGGPASVSSTVEAQLASYVS